VSAEEVFTITAFRGDSTIQLPPHVQCRVG
jgi:hypothetical protein